LSVGVPSAMTAPRYGVSLPNHAACVIVALLIVTV